MLVLSVREMQSRVPGRGHGGLSPGTGRLQDQSAEGGTVLQHGGSLAYSRVMIEKRCLTESRFRHNQPRIPASLPATFTCAGQA